MKSRALRAVIVLLALAAQAGAGYKVWLLEQQVARARSDAADFDRRARLAVLGLTEIRAAQQAYVAEGQPSETWQRRVDSVSRTTTPQLTELRLAATSAEAQGGLEAAVEAFSAFGQTDAKARDYVKSSQRLSASDVIFTDGSSLLTKAINAIDTARGQEVVAREIVIAGIDQLEVYFLAGAAVFTLVVILLLVPLPAASAPREPADSAGADGADAPSGGLGLSHVASDRPANIRGPGLDSAPIVSPNSELDRLIGETSGPDLSAVADICSAFARVEDPRELHGLLERAAKALDATGLIIWMPEGPQGSLRPVLAYGYAPLSLTRMGAIDVAADNATAVAFRTREAQVVNAEPLSNGAIVAPLVTSDGCSGTMAVELKEGVRTTAHLKSVATILAAQLATLITPSTQAAAQEPPSATS